MQKKESGAIPNHQLETEDLLSRKLPSRFINQEIMKPGDMFFHRQSIRVYGSSQRFQAVSQTFQVANRLFLKTKVIL